MDCPFFPSDPFWEEFAVTFTPPTNFPGSHMHAHTTHTHAHTHTYTHTGAHSFPLSCGCANHLSYACCFTTGHCTVWLRCMSESWTSRAAVRVQRLAGIILSRSIYMHSLVLPCQFSHPQCQIPPWFFPLAFFSSSPPPPAPSPPPPPRFSRLPNWCKPPLVLMTPVGTATRQPAPPI